MKIEVTIRREDEEEDVINLTHIKNIQFKSDTIDTYPMDRTGNIVNKIDIEGEIVKENQEMTKKLIDWSFAKTKSEIYREVEIVAYDADDVIRRYQLDTVFVMDYTEKFDQTNATYKLEISQRQANLDKIFVTTR
ncbi:MAG: hypothetical protein R3Y64_08955 [Peptostreptococcaceae bacterium]